MSPENSINPGFDIFISYSSKEKAIADAGVADLSKSRIDTDVKEAALGE